MRSRQINVFRETREVNDIRIAHVNAMPSADRLRLGAYLSATPQISCEGASHLSSERVAENQFRLAKSDSFQRSSFWSQVSVWLGNTQQMEWRACWQFAVRLCRLRDVSATSLVASCRALVPTHYSGTLLTVEYSLQSWRDALLQEKRGRASLIGSKCRGKVINDSILIIFR